MDAEIRVVRVLSEWHLRATASMCFHRDFPAIFGRFSSFWREESLRLEHESCIWFLDWLKLVKQWVKEICVTWWTRKSNILLVWSSYSLIKWYGPKFSLAQLALNAHNGVLYVRGFLVGKAHAHASNDW